MLVDGWLRVFAWYTIVFIAFEVVGLIMIGGTIPLTFQQAGILITLVIPILLLAILTIRKTKPGGKL